MTALEAMQGSVKLHRSNIVAFRAIALWSQPA